MKMALGLCVMALVLSASATEVVQPSAPEHLAIVIRETTMPATIVVELRSRGGRNVRVWRDSNTWGAARWRVLVVRNETVTTHFQETDEGFTRNIPAYDEISAEQPPQITLDLRGKIWRRHETEVPSFKQGDIVVVVYDVPPTAEAHKMGVWHGVVAASHVIK